MERWIENFVKAIVTEPDSVEVTQSEGTITNVLQIRISEVDADRFAGRNNRLVRALGTAAQLAGLHSRTRYVLKIVS